MTERAKREIRKARELKELDMMSRGEYPRHKDQILSDKIKRAKNREVIMYDEAGIY